MKKLMSKVKGLIATATVFIMTTSISCASGFQPVTKAKNIIGGEIESLFIIIVMFLGIVFIVARKIIMGISFLLVAGLGAVFIYSPEVIMQKISNVIVSLL